MRFFRFKRYPAPARLHPADAMSVFPFQWCDACNDKPGAAQLCAGCLANRLALSTANELYRAVFIELGEEEAARLLKLAGDRSGEPHQ